MALEIDAEMDESAGEALYFPSGLAGSVPETLRQSLRCNLPSALP